MNQFDRKINRKTKVFVSINDEGPLGKKKARDD